MAAEKFFFFLLVAVVVVGGVIWYLHAASQNAEEAARVTVIDFGQALQTVSLTDPNAAQAIAQNYAPYVAPALLAQWEANPQAAPGRLTPSPWPDHITITSVADDGLGGYRVQGDVVELTSGDIAAGTIADQYSITATVVQTNGAWLITAWQRGMGQ